MGHIPDDKNYDEFMGASAEDWSKPEEPAAVPKAKADETNRWGATTPDASVSESTSRWGTEPVDPSSPKSERPAKQGKSKWWVILIVAVVLICLCVCVVVFVLPLLGLSLIPTDWLQY